MLYIGNTEHHALNSHYTLLQGEDEKKSVYVTKLDELLKLGRPIEERYQEEQSRPGEQCTGFARLLLAVIAPVKSWHCLHACPSCQHCF